MMHIASLVVILFGVYTLYRGYGFIIDPDKSVLNCCEVEGVNESNVSGEGFLEGSLSR